MMNAAGMPEQQACCQKSPEAGAAYVPASDVYTRQCRHERLSRYLCVELRLLFRSSTIRVHSLHKSLAILAGKQKYIECPTRPEGKMPHAARRVHGFSLPENKMRFWQTVMPHAARRAIRIFLAREQKMLLAGGNDPRGQRHDI